MIPLNDVLTGYWSWLNADTILRSICGDTGRVIKGVRMPDRQAFPCITVQMPNRAHSADWAGTTTMLKTTEEPALISCFAAINENGTVNEPQLSTMCARVHTLASTSRPAVTGGTVHRLGAYSESGPVFNPSDPDEAYMVIALGFHIRDNA
jgi:hypothetical protein